MELGVQKHINQLSSAAVVYDLFVPLAQRDGQLLYADIRLFDRSGKSSEGNLHLGCRHLDLSRQKLWGIYAAYDLRRNNRGISYSQITMGAEYWWHRWFFGINGYQPLNKKQHLYDHNYQEMGRGYMSNSFYERALGGVDGEVGYAFSNEFTGYVGGYYFHGDNERNIAGPKAMVRYDYQNTGGRLPNVINKISVELGGQHDRVRGLTGYVGLKLRIGLAHTKNRLQGLERHMTDLVRRDPDIVIGFSQKKNFVHYQPGEHGYQFNDSPPGGSENNTQPPSKEDLDKIKAEFTELLRAWGLSDQASIKEACREYRRRSLELHPDKNGGDASDFIKLVETKEKMEELWKKLQSFGFSTDAPFMGNETHNYNNGDYHEDSSEKQEEDIESLFAEIRRLNDAVDDGTVADWKTRFTEAHDTMLLLREDWRQAKYEVKVTVDKPEIYPGVIYMYGHGGQMCTATVEREYCSKKKSTEESDLLTKKVEGAITMLSDREQSQLF